MRAVIYARYSTDLQSHASIEDQLRLCRARIEAEGWSLVATYTDHALSGASRRRPGYQKLLEDACADARPVRHGASMRVAQASVAPPSFSQRCCIPALI